MNAKVKEWFANLRIVKWFAELRLFSQMMKEWKKDFELVDNDQ